MEWQALRITILGLGKSGLAAARALAARGSELVLNDQRETETLLPLVADLPADRIHVEGGGHSAACLAADMIVVSPGVPVGLPILQAAIADGVPVIGELELAYRLAGGALAPPMVAITGTNGKTTTTTLVGEILKEAGKRAPVGGNIGVPLVSLIEEPADAFVLEVSSFQLETTHDFRPRVACFLNFTDDHLDRHGSREAYMAAKRRIFENQGEGDWAVLNADDPAVAGLASGLAARKLFFSAHQALAEGVCVADGWIVQRIAGAELRVVPVGAIRLRGAHNLENCLAAVAIAAALGLPAQAVRRAIEGFSGVEHRIEPTRTVAGVLYVNDSKGTNYASTVKAIESFSEPLVLIAGGRDKGGAIGELVSAVRARVDHVVLVGEAAPYFERVLAAAGYRNVTRAESLEAAVTAAGREAAAGGVVLFSPACTSFDMFKNYEERGRAFKALVQSIGEHAPI